MNLSKLLRSWILSLRSRPAKARRGARRAPCRYPKRKWRKGFKKVASWKHWVTCFHGTPDPHNACSILRHGWRIGPSGGLYFAKDRATAKAYAGEHGVVLKCRIHPKPPNAANNPVIILPPHAGLNKRRHEVRVVSVHRPDGRRVWV